ncbi:cytochrome P450 [Trichoderma velutinum]
MSSITHYSTLLLAVCIDPKWRWLVGTIVIVVSLYALDIIARWYRDRKLKQFGSPAPLVRFRLPLGMDVAVTTAYALFTHSFLERVEKWLSAVPGRTVDLRTFGVSMFVTDEPDNIRAIMSTNWSNFGKGDVARGVFGNMMGDAIFIIDGDIWHQTKDMLRPHVGVLRSNDLEITEMHVQNLFQHFNTSPAVEVYDLIDRFQLDVTTEVYLGESASSLATNKQPFRQAMDTLFTINTTRILFGKLSLLFPDTWIAPKAIENLHSYTRGLYKRALARDFSKKSPEDYNLLDDLIMQNKDYEVIRCQMIAIMLGGKDPSSILITWSIFEMGRHPRIMKKMKAEVERICGSKPPTASQLKELTYVRHVINETFRMYHPLGLNIKHAMADTTLPTGGGPTGKEPLAVPKGTSVMYSTVGMQRRKDIYGEDAHVFRPERWGENTPNRWHFLPYNHGVRICMGRNFGQQQLEYILARICQDYAEIRIPSDQPKQQIRVELNTKMAHPCLCEFVREEKKNLE